MYEKMTDAELLIKVANGVYKDDVEVYKIEHSSGHVKTRIVTPEDEDFGMNSMHPLWAEWYLKFIQLKSPQIDYVPALELAIASSITPRGIAEAIAEVIDAEGKL